MSLSPVSFPYPLAAKMDGAENKLFFLAQSRRDTRIAVAWHMLASFA